jgi:hypothetical protein
LGKCTKKATNIPIATKYIKIGTFGLKKYHLATLGADLLSGEVVSQLPLPHGLPQLVDEPRQLKTYMQKRINQWGM